MFLIFLHLLTSFLVFEIVCNFFVILNIEIFFFNLTSSIDKFVKILNIFLVLFIFFF